MKKRILAIVLSLCMIFTLTPCVAMAAPANNFADTSGHWAEGAIDRWAGYGVIEGYDGLSFEPNGQLTRAQLAAIIARLLNLPVATGSDFTDIDGHWAADVISRCAQAGIMLGSDGKARPDDAVSREETMVMLGRALGIKPVESTTLDSYPDASNVSSWAKGYVAALAENNIVNGIAGELMPSLDINRASAVTILNRAISAYANESGQTVMSEGGGIVLVVAENVTVTGDADAVLIAQGAAGGTTTIENATIKGEVTVAAGESNVVLSGETKAASVEVTEVASGTKVEVGKMAAVETVSTKAENTEVAVSGTVASVEVTETAAGAKVEVAKTAKVETVTTKAENTELAVSGKVTNVEVSENASNTKVEAAAGSNITNVDNKAEGTTVKGAGKVENVTTSGNNTTVDTTGTKVEAAAGTTGTTAGGNKVEGGSIATTVPETSYDEPSEPEHSHSYTATYTAIESDLSVAKHTAKCECGETTDQNCTLEAGVCSVCGRSYDAVAMIGTTGYATIADASAEASVGAIFTFPAGIINTDNIEFPFGEEYPAYNAEHHVYGNNITLSGGTFTLDNSRCFGMFLAPDGGTITVDGMTITGDSASDLYIQAIESVTLIKNTTVNSSAGAAIYSEYSNAGVVLENCTVNQTGLGEGNKPWFNTAVAASGGSQVTINSGTYESASGWAVYCFGSDYRGYDTVVTINGGTFSGKLEVLGDDQIIINDGRFNNVTFAESAEGTISISGGTFDADPSAYLADGCIATEEVGSWTVTKIFSAGTGTESDPYIIANLDELKNIAEITDYSYFKMADGVGTLDASTWSRINLYGNFDGNGVTFNNLGDFLFNRVGTADYDKTYTIKNINIVAKIRTSYAAALVRTAPANLVIENVDVTGTIEGTNGAASYIAFGPGNNVNGNSGNVDFNVTFRDCYSDATIIATGDYAAGFIKHPYSNQLTSLIIIEDSAFTGKMTATKDGHGNTTVENNRNLKYFIGNSNKYRVKEIYSSEFVYDPAVLHGAVKNSDGITWVGNYATEGGDSNAKNDYYRPGDATMKSVLTVTTGNVGSLGEVLTITKASGATKAIASLEVAPNDSNGTGSYLGTYMTETITLTESETFTTETIKYFNITINAGGETGVVGDNTFNVQHNMGGNTHNGANVRVVQYDSNDNIVNITTFRIANPS